MIKASKLPRTLDQAFEDGGLGGNEKLVFIVLCRRGNARQIGFMSIERLMVECGLSRSTVTRALRSLRQKGRIVLEGRRGRSGINQYALRPYGQSDLDYGSKRPSDRDQYDLQNQNLNQNLNRKGPVESRGISVREGSAVPLGDVTNRMMSKISK